MQSMKNDLMSNLFMLNFNINQKSKKNLHANEKIYSTQFITDYKNLDQDLGKLEHIWNQQNLLNSF
jgi:hypothetical protein